MSVPSLSSSSNPSRRAFLTRLLAAVGASISVGAGVARADTPEADAPQPVIYLPDQGHHLGGPMLVWWLQYGREEGIGWPVTEQVRLGSRRVQFFERGALELAPTSREPLGVVPVEIGRAYVSRRPTPSAPQPGQYFRQTGVAAHPDLWPYHRESGGVFRFGYPLAPAVEGANALWQVFGRAVLVSAGSRVSQLPLGIMEANRRGVPMAPVPRARHAPVVDLQALDPLYGPPADRRAQVDLTRQVVTFFDGDTPVRQAATSTGVYPDYTPSGSYRIFMRVPRARMVSNGSTAAEYDLDDIQHIQYFTERWIGFHYAYWHDEFGQTRSAGCVNLRLDDSRWAWNFCDHGTPVVVHH